MALPRQQRLSKPNLIHYEKKFQMNEFMIKFCTGDNLAAVVYYKIYTYGSSLTNKVIPGLSFQLLNNYDIRYTREITTSDLNNNAHTEMVKFHGPALPLDYVFATSDSTTDIRIADNTRYFFIDNFIFL